MSFFQGWVDNIFIFILESYTKFLLFFQESTTHFSSWTLLLRKYFQDYTAVMVRDSKVESSQTKLLGPAASYKGPGPAGCVRILFSSKLLRKYILHSCLFGLADCFYLILSWWMIRHTDWWSAAIHSLRHSDLKSIVGWSE